MAGNVIGSKALNRNLDRLAKVGGSKKVRRGVQYIAEEIRDRIIQRASGGLKEVIVSKPFRTKGGGLSFVAVDRKKKDRKGRRIGKVAHLVEFGHGGKSPAPPHPFFRPIIDLYRGDIYRARMAGILKGEIERTVK